MGKEITQGMGFGTAEGCKFKGDRGRPGTRPSWQGRGSSKDRKTGESAAFTRRPARLRGRASSAQCGGEERRASKARDMGTNLEEPRETSIRSA